MKWSEYTKAVSERSVTNLKMNLASLISKLRGADKKQTTMLRRQIHCICLELKGRRNPAQTEFLQRMYDVYPIEPLPDDFWL